MYLAELDHTKNCNANLALAGDGCWCNNEDDFCPICYACDCRGEEIDMSVPMLDPVACNKEYQNHLEQTVLNVLRSGKFILGDEVVSFEKRAAQFIGTKEAIGVSSGTDALLVALQALNLKPGDEVICPSFTFFATAGAIARLGGIPVFVDISEDCFTSTADLIEEAITDKTHAIILVHLFGQCADAPTVLEVANKHGIFLIEDTAQAMGAEIDNQQAGSIGHVNCFSFFPSKNLGGFGDAGLVTTNDPVLAENIRHIRNHGMTTPYNHTIIGGNFRIDAMQAALLNTKLDYLPIHLAQRQTNAEVYKEKLKSICTLPQEIRGKHTYNQFTILVEPELRDDLVASLRKEDIGCAVYYPIPLHQQPCFSHLPVKELQVTEKVSKSCLSIPIAAELTKLQIERSAKVIVDSLSSLREKKM